MKAFVLLASIFGLLFVFLTPPCYAPDEVAHFWRAVSIAHGTLNPTAGKAPVPKGYEILVFCVMHGNAKLTRPMFETAWDVDPHAHELVNLRVVPASYTPANYLPQIAAALIGRLTGARPLLVFYLGRLFALAAFIALVAFAIDVTPVLKWGFCAAALLPMTLFMAASWSADSLTIGVAFVVTALGLRKLESLRHVEQALSLLLGMCKPGYFLIPLIAKRWLPMLASIVGFIIATLLAVNASTSSQECFPTLVIAKDYVAHGALYAEQLVGRLGMLDVFLPRWLIRIEWIFLAVLAITAGESVPRVQRLLAMFVVLATMGAISVGLYFAWTPSCASLIEGIQGRYFLPIVPLALIAISNPRWRWWRPGPLTTSVIACFANVVALHALIGRYY